MKNQSWKGRLLLFAVVAVFLGGILSVYGGAPPATPLNGQSGTTYSTTDIVARGDLYVVDELFIGAAGDFKISNTGADTASLGAGDTLTGTFSGAFSGTFAGVVNATSPTPYDYIVFKIGANYYANSTTGGTNYLAPSFVTIANTVNTALANGGSVYIKSGVYTYGVAFTLGGRDNVTWVGEADTILKANASIATAGFRILGSGDTDHDKHITVKGITFDNNYLTSGPYFKWVDDLEVVNCRVLNTVNASLRGGITVAGTSGHPCLDTRIINNYVDFAGGPGISVAYISNFTISGNTVNGVCRFDYPAGGCIKTDAESNYGVISGNTLTGITKNDGIYAGVSTGYCQSYSITGNTIILTDRHDSATSGIKIFLDNSVVSDNTITIAGEADGSVGIHTAGQYNIVSDNRIKGGGTAWAGVYMENSAGTDSYNLISDNIITGFDGYGVNCETDYNSFRNNMIISEPVGIRFEASASSNDVVGDNYRACTTDISDAGAGNIAHCYLNKTGVYVP